MKKAICGAAVIGLLGLSVPAMADGTYHDLSVSNFSQNWGNTALITANDNWSGVPSIIGYLGDRGTFTTPADLSTVTDDPGTTIVDVNANQTNTGTFNTGGVTEFELTNPTIALAGSGTADTPYFVIHLNSTNRKDVQLTANLRDLESVDNTNMQVVFQYRVGTSGAWSNITGGYIADATDATATLVTPVSITLPAGANNQAQVQIRVMSANATGNDEWVGIDDIVVSSTSLAANSAPTLDTATLGPAAPTSASTISFGVNAVDSDGTVTGVNAFYSFSASATPGTFTPLALSLTAGTASNGTWTGTIAAPATGNNVFVYYVATDDDSDTGSLGSAGAPTNRVYVNDSRPAAGQIVVNEIMITELAPQPATDWFELANTTGTARDLSYFKFSDNTANEFVFPFGTTIAANGYLVVTQNAGLFSAYGPWSSAAVIGGHSIGLGGGGDSVEVYNDANTLIDEVIYTNTTPWTGAVGTGRTVELRNPTLDNSIAANWSSTAAGNVEGSPGAVNFAFDATAPTVASIVRQSPSAATTNAASVTFRATFSEDVTGVNDTDFAVDATGVTGASVTTVTPVNASTYDVVVSTGSGDGSLSIDVPGTATISDLASNAFSAAFTAGEAYTIDRTAPTVGLASGVPSLTNAASFSVTATLSEPSADFLAMDVTASNATVTPLSGGPTVYTFDVFPVSDGAVTVQVGVGTFSDSASNNNTTASNTISTTSDRTAPTSSAAVADATQVGTIAGTLNANDANGVTSVTLYARLAPSGAWASVGDFSGTFSFSPATAGSYYLQSAATDAAGNAETAPTGSTGTGDATVTFNTAPNAAFTQAIGADGSFGFPMESGLDVTVDLTGVTAGTLTVSRSEGNTAPAGFQADQLIDQAITFTTGGGLTFTNANVTVEYDEALLGGLTEAAITSAYRDDAGTVTGPFAVTVNTTLNTISFPATGFSTWYFGTATASVDEWMLLD